MELLNITDFSKIYETQIKIGALNNYLHAIQFEDGALLKSLNKHCIRLAEELGGGYFWYAHWLVNPLDTKGAYHLYCLQIVKD